jgi:hypothetical protein
MLSAAPARLDLETALIKKCWQDPAFQKEVVANPRGMWEKATSQKLPDNVKIFIHEEDQNTIHLSIPPPPGTVGELSDAELERVAGGTEIAVGVLFMLTLAVAIAGNVAESVIANQNKPGW